MFACARNCWRAWFSATLWTTCSETTAVTSTAIRLTANVTRTIRPVSEKTTLRRNPMSAVGPGRAVADAAHGPDQPARRAELEPELGDVDIDRAAAAVVGDSPDAREELFAGEDTPGLGHQVREQVELGRSEVDRFACGEY